MRILHSIPWNWSHKYSQTHHVRFYWCHHCTHSRGMRVSYSRFFAPSLLFLPYQWCGPPHLTIDITNVAKAINPDVIVLCHGGPISMPEDAEYVLNRTTGVDGCVTLLSRFTTDMNLTFYLRFYGASSMERLPVETAITQQIKQFKDIHFWSREYKNNVFASGKAR